MPKEKHICKDNAKFICGKNKCAVVCCPECVIEHYIQCCFNNETIKNIMSKKLDDEKDIK